MKTTNNNKSNHRYTHTQGTLHIPSLRFPEFKGEWEQKKFGDIFSFRVTNSFSRDKLNYTSGKVKNIHYGDIHTKFSTLFDITKEHMPFINMEVEVKRIDEENYCKVGDLVITDASEDYNGVGKSIEIVNLNNEKLLAGLHTILARPAKAKVGLGFFGYYFLNEGFRTRIKKIAQGSKVLSISSKRLADIEIIIPPTLPEQKRIASFFTVVDKKIAELKQKKALLEQYKKGVMQKLFSQELRFKDDNGKEFPKWEKKKLGEIADSIMYGMNAAAINYDGENKYLRITDIDENSRTFIPNPLSSPEGRIEDKFKLKVGDIVFARTGASVGKSYLYNEKDGNLFFAGFLIKFSIKNANPYFIFLQTLLQAYKKWVVKMSMRSGQPGINAEEYKQLTILYPCIEEQNKIANFLSAIDDKINQTEYQIQQTQEWKKGLLQKMFV
jgi:type I restriction enzyme S subunit